jgi:hypothetical protein
VNNNSSLGSTYLYNNGTRDLLLIFMYIIERDLRPVAWFRVVVPGAERPSEATTLAPASLSH